MSSAAFSFSTSSCNTEDDSVLAQKKSKASKDKNIEEEATISWMSWSKLYNNLRERLLKNGQSLQNCILLGSQV